MRETGIAARPSAISTLALLLAVAPPGHAAEPGWRVEAALGAGHSFGSTVSVEQAGFSPLEVEADWDGRNFESPPYYALRVAREDSRGAWALRFVHLKVYLASPPPEIERFSVSHGYNLLTVERSFPWHGFDLWAGLGLVVAHPESTVRGQTWSEAGGGYVVTGPSGALAFGRRVQLGRHVAVVPEARFALSRARVPIADGEASVPNASVHVLLGLELRF